MKEQTTNIIDNKYEIRGYKSTDETEGKQTGNAKETTHMRRKNKVCTGTPSIKSEIHKN